MRNFISSGDTLTVTAPYAVTAGQALQVGTLFGVAVTDAAINTPVTIITRGRFNITCLGTDTPAQGAALYWDNTNRRLTTTASTHKLVGNAVTAKASGPTEVDVIIHGQA